MSFAVLITLLSAGWMALSFLRSEFTGRPSGSGAESKSRQEAPVSTSSVEPVAESQGAARPSILVYFAASDAVYYHNSTHLHALTGRTALSEQAARSRGLKPCPVCWRH